MSAPLNLNAMQSELFNSVKQEIVEMAEESMSEESIPNELYDEESKYITDQIIDKNDKVWSDEDFVTTWNAQSAKTETSEDFNGENEATAHIVSKLEVKNEWNELKVAEKMEDSHSIRGENHIQNENTECTMTKIEGVTEKTETIDDFNTYEESKYIINQIVDENGKVCREEDSLTSGNFHFVKMEESEHFNSGTEYSKSNEEDKSEIHFPIQMEPSQPKCDLPKNLDSIKRKNHKCHLCDYSSSRRGDLRTHIKSIHLKLKNYKCHLCDYSSAREGDLRTHIKSIHLKLKNHKCHLCDYTSSQKGSIQPHIRSMHLKLRNFKCNLCNYSSPQATNLQKHVKSIHLKLKNHKCNLCDYSSFYKGHLQRHMKSVHLKLKNHKCNLFNHSSPPVTKLEKHLNTVHLKNHKCNLCDYCSSRQADLQRHTKAVHLKLKNYKCNLCHYSSLQARSLEQHIKLAHL